MAHHIRPALRRLLLGWFQICVSENSFKEHALWLLQILSFSDASETKTSVLIIL